MGTWLRALRDRLRGVARRDVVTDEIHEEIQFHLDRRVEEHERRGLDPAAARHAARRRFGNPSAIADRGYDVRGGGFMESLLQDVKYAVRLLVKQRGYSIVALATLTLGIGATTAIFCITDAALIRPLPYDRPEQLVRIDLTRPERPGTRQAGSLADMDHWRALSHVFSHVGVDRGESLVVVSGPEPERVTIDRVTVDYLALTAAEPVVQGPVPLVLDDYALDGSPERGSALYLEVRGPDRLGFLGSLLRTLARLDLVPKEMTIGTRDGEAFDRFLLKAADGQVPSDRTRQVLSATLERTVRRRVTMAAAI